MQYATFSVSTLAIIVALVSLYVTQQRTDRREFDKWRRDNILRITSELLQISNRRQQDLNDHLGAMTSENPPPREDFDTFGSVSRMRFLVDELRLLDDELVPAALRVHDAHAAAHRIAAPDADPYTELEALLADPAELGAAHADLIDGFRRTAHADKHQWNLPQQLTNLRDRVTPRDQE